MSAAASPMLTELEARAAQLPALVGASSALVARQFVRLAIETREPFSARSLRWDVVGVGASSLPAELLVHVLNSAGVAARHVPLTAFLGKASGEGAVPSERRALVLFSQGLSPNARLALPALYDVERGFVITATQEDDDSAAVRQLSALPPHVTVIRHLPEREQGTLLRMQGPLCAAEAALQLADYLLANEARHSLAPDRPHLQRLFEAQPPAEPLGAPVLTWLALGVPVLTARAAAWSWQEGLHEPALPALDLLSFAHGAFQATWDRPGLHIVLTRAGTRADLVPRLREMLPARQTFVEVEVTASEALAPLLLAARVSDLLLAEMRARGLDPAHWPGQGQDDLLYRLGE